MLRHLLVLSSVFALGGCAYVLDKQIQDIEIVTPGANDAVCYMHVDGLRYKVFPPQTLNITKSEENLTVDCLAPGNRRQKVVVEPQINNKVYGNVANGIVPGGIYDYITQAAYKYPDVIEVDFTNAPLRPEDPPAHNNPDIRQPEDYPLEEFRPGVPRLNSDRYNVSEPIRMRQRPVEVTGDAINNMTIDQTSTAPVMGKGDLMNVIDNLGPAMDPSAAPSAKANETSGNSSDDDGSAQYGPIPLYPGE